MKLGWDAVVVSTAFEEFVVRVRQSDARAQPVDLELVRWAAREFRAGIDLGTPEIVRSALTLLRALNADGLGLDRSHHEADGSAFGARAPSRHGGSRAPETAVIGLAGRIEQELLAGRLVVERHRLDSLEEREFERPQLPPLGPAAPTEQTESFIAVRLLDQDSKAVIGRRWLIELPDGSQRNGRTDPDGWARVAGFVKDGLAKVRFPDFDEIDTATRNAADREIIPIGAEGVEEEARALEPGAPELEEQQLPGLSFLDVQLVDQKEKPMAGRKYEITLPDGTIETGVLGSDARIRKANVAHGTAKIRLLPEPGESVDGSLPETEAAAGETANYSVRVVGVDGAPLVGLTMAFAFGTATRFAETNADGIAELEGPGSPSPTVQVADVAELRRIRSQLA